jgi:uncharacterized protein YdaU (DUF1376 family)
MPNELPFFPIYTSDILTAMASWPAERAGAYCLALFYQWEHGHVPTRDAAELGLVLHVSSGRARKLWAEIASKFVIDPDGHARNERLENIRAQVRLEIAMKSGRGKAGAEGRWGKREQRSSNAQASPEQSLSNAIQNQTQVTPPVPPAARGAAHVRTGPPTRDEKAAALDELRAYRKSVDYNRTCQHEPQCGDELVCIGRIVQERRQAIAAGQAIESKAS